jgi:hypothetical protein
LVQLVQYLLVLAAHHGNDRVIGIDAVNHASHRVDLPPQRRPLLRRSANLQFVAQRPSQDGRVVLVPLHNVPQLFALPVHGGRISVVEAPALLAERQVDEYAQAQRLRAIERRNAGADRVAAGRGQLFEMHPADRAFDEIRLAVTQK